MIAALGALPHEALLGAALALGIFGVTLGLVCFGRQVPGELWQFCAIIIGVVYKQRQERKDGGA